MIIIGVFVLTGSFLYFQLDAGAFYYILMNKLYVEFMEVYEEQESTEKEGFLD